MSWKAYPTAWPTQQAMRNAASRWHRRRLLTTTQRQAIEAAYPLGFYRPGLLLRIGLFLFTCVGVAGAVAFLALFGAIAQLEDFRLLGWAVALGCLAGLELLIRSSRHYHSGSDTALLYIALATLAVLLTDAAETLMPAAYRYTDSLANPYLPLLLLPLLVLLLLATIRYADRLVAAALYLTFLLLTANWLLQMPAGQLLLPFVLMLVAAGTYRLLRRLRQRPDYLYYHPCLQVLKILTLATFYLAGNYYIVREGNAQLSGLYPSAQIPLAPLFYLFTALIPVVYIAVGLRQPSRVWLLTGLAATAFSLFTLRYYRAILPPEIAAVLAGVLLLGVAAWATRYLRPARHDLTSLPNDEQLPHFNLESLVVAQTAVVPQAPPAGLEFGGGHSGGAGAEGTY